MLTPDFIFGAVVTVGFVFLFSYLRTKMSDMAWKNFKISVNTGVTSPKPNLNVHKQNSAKPAANTNVQKVATTTETKATKDVSKEDATKIVNS